MPSDASPRAQDAVSPVRHHAKEDYLGSLPWPSCIPYGPLSPVFPP